MSGRGTSKVSVSSLKFRKIGTWEDIVDVSDDISDLLESLDSNDFEQEITEDQFDKLYEEWNEWKPKEEDNFSKEMRTKTAKQSSVDESELEKEGRETMDEVQVAEDSIKKATEKVKDKDFSVAKDQFIDGIKCVKKAVDCELRKGVRTIEENIYKKIILKTNSLYFDNSILNIVLSKNRGAKPSEKYQLDLYSNSPRMRELFATRIDWNGN